VNFDRYQDINELLAIIFIALTDYDAKRQTILAHCSVDLNALSSLMAIEFHELAAFFESTSVLSTETTFNDSLLCE
jgi:hypothetical protein